jgi:hypothetical protein
MKALQKELGDCPRKISRPVAKKLNEAKTRIDAALPPLNYACSPVT